MKIKHFNNFFNEIYYIHFKNVPMLQNNIETIIDIFNSNYLLLSAVALDLNSEIFNNLLKSPNTYQVITPSRNSITAETKILFTTEYAKLIWNPLINSLPRCITLYGFNGNSDNKKNLIQECSNNVGDNKLLIDNIVDFVLSINLEENFSFLTFNKYCFDHKEILKTIKQKIE